MRDRPEGLMLLQLAETTLREQLLPALSEDKKYVALMVLKALSIAGRQLSADLGPLVRERDALEAALQVNQRSGDVRADLAALERELAQRVRSGACDEHSGLQRLLWDLTCQRVRESAPRYLESEAIE